MLEKKVKAADGGVCRKEKGGAFCRAPREDRMRGGRWLQQPGPGFVPSCYRPRAFSSIGKESVHGEIASEELMAKVQDLKVGG